jgi:four helix bundle protein
LPRDVASIELARQLIRSGTSVGASVEEADDAESTRDKIHKCSVAGKEAKETRLWLRTMKEAESASSPELEALLAESRELAKILSSIIINMSKAAS